MFILFLPLALPDVALTLDTAQVLQAPNFFSWGGTDSLGRSLLLRCVVGAYLSLLICVFSLILTYILGGFIGSILSYWRQANHLTVFFIDVFDSIPNFLLVALFSILLNKGLGSSISTSQSFVVLVVSIALATWPPIARNLRLEILQMLGKDYLSATIVAGGSPLHIITTHYGRALWPWVKMSIGHNIPHFLLIESVLSFTGFGFSSQYATLGYLIHEGWKNALLYPHLFIVPSVVLCLVVFFLSRVVRLF